MPRLPSAPEVPDAPALPALPAGWSSWEDLMRLALAQAEQAAAQGEVPVGAVLISPEGEILASAANAPIASNDPTAHAEVRALRAAGQRLGNYRMPGAVMVVSLEPCLMCLGALVHARMGGLVYAAPDPKTGAIAGAFSGLELEFLNHRFPVLGGVLAEESGELLRGFFRDRRKA